VSRIAATGGDSVSDERVLWALAKGDQTAQAVMRRVPEVGLELCFLWNGDLAHSQIYRDGGELLRVAEAKREELQGRGWQEPS
jgi:hypothetical protein